MELRSNPEYYISRYTPNNAESILAPRAEDDLNLFYVSPYGQRYPNLTSYKMRALEDADGLGNLDIYLREVDLDAFKRENHNIEYTAEVIRQTEGDRGTATIRIEPVAPHTFRGNIEHKKAIMGLVRCEYARDTPYHF